MTDIRKRLLPQWARNPLLDFEWFHPHGGASRRKFVLQLLMLGVLLVSAAQIYASAIGSFGAAENVTHIVWRSLYFPTLALQTLTAIVALLLGAAALDSQRQANIWDNLLVTESGAGLALRARWLSILFRLRAPIAAILLVRLVLALGMLLELTAFGGSYLQVLNSAAATSVADWRILLPLIALSLAACFALPLTMIASYALFGILIGLVIRDRLFAVVLQILLVATLVVFVSATSLAVSQILQDELMLAGAASFWLFLSVCGFGDWGLALMQLGSLGAIWQHVPFGAGIGFGMAGLVLVQAYFADGLMWLARRAAERQN